MDYRDITAASMEAFCEEFADLTLDGWAVVKQGNKGDCFFGCAFSVSMYRDEATVEAFRQATAGIASKPKLTRAESLAKARAARASNAAAKLSADVVTGE